MKKLIVASLALVVASAGASADPLGVELVSGQTLDAFVRSANSALAVHPAFETRLSSALIVRRSASGEVERHASMNDIMVAREGSVAILLGGSIDGGHETTPGEWRGGRIVGGKTMTMKAGDMLWIPAGVPHQMILGPGKSFTYIALKVPMH